MNNVLRLKLFQQTACYKKPFAFKVGETYPLPPYSTVKGMLHAVIGATQFVPMRLSIQGIFDTIIVDYQTYYLYKSTDTDEVPLVLDGIPEKPSYKKITSMPLYNHMLYNVNLILHVNAEEQVRDQIMTAIADGEQHMSLGRWEDLVRIDDCRQVEVHPLGVDKEIELKYDAYIPMFAMTDRLQYIPYRLNWTYEIKNGMREWSRVDVGYVQHGQELVGPPFLVDEDGYPIMFHLREWNSDVLC